MIQLPQDFDSIFRYIVVVSQRAEQIINGAKPRTESRHAKPTLVARTDVDAGEVPWRILTQEELDARRQEIVDQFRAEVGGEEEGAEGEVAIPDVLPTAPGEAEAVEETMELDEKDDELARLQRLLGMAGKGLKDAAAGIGAADLEGGEESFDLADAEPLEAVTEKEGTDDEAEEEDE